MSHLVYIILVIAIFQSAFVFISFLFKKDIKAFNSITIQLVNFFITLQLILKIVMYNDNLFSFVDYFKAYYLIYQTAYILPPLLYVHIKSVFISGYSFKQSELLHLIPFLLAVIIASVLSYGFDMRLYFYYTRPFIIIQSLIYFVLCVLCVKSTKFKFSLKIKSMTIKGFSIILLLFFLLLTLANIQHYLVTRYFHIPHKCFCETSIYATLLFLIANTLAFISIVNPKMLHFQKKYKSSQIPNGDKESINDRIINIIQDNKLFQNPELTIKDVSKELSVPERHISQIINDLHNTNFKDFINTFRINYAKELIINRNYKEYSVMDVCFEAGFNSKSNFNLVFKKKTNCTPLEYRKINFYS